MQGKVYIKRGSWYAEPEPEPEPEPTIVGVRQRRLVNQKRSLPIC